MINDTPFAHLVAVPSDLSLPSIEIRLSEEVICSETISSSSEKHRWCKITKNDDQSSATILNMRYYASYNYIILTYKP